MRLSWVFDLNENLLASVVVLTLLNDCLGVVIEFGVPMLTINQISMDS